MSNIIIALNNNFIIHTILILFFLLFLWIGIKSEGYYKIFMSISGILLAGYGILFNSYFINGLDDISLVIICRALGIMFIALGIGLIYIGFMEMIEKDNTEG